MATDLKYYTINYYSVSIFQHQVVLLYFVTTNSLLQLKMLLSRAYLYTQTLMTHKHSCSWYPCKSL